MKKTCLALLCVVGLTLCLAALPAKAAGDTFFLGLNDTLPVQSVQTTPIQYNGWIYIPMGVFNAQNTGVNFGVYCGLTKNNTNLVFYDLNGKNMTFDLVNGTATAAGGSTPMPSTVLHRNGTYYAPAYTICQYFGLTYSYYTTEYGPLLRIRDGNAILSDTLFLNSTASIMKSRVGTGDSQSGEQETPSSPNPSPSPKSSPSQGNSSSKHTDPDAVEETPKFSLSLGILAAAWNDLTPVMDALASPKSDAVIFFPAGEIADCSDDLRQAAGQGYRIGLIPTGETEKQQLESVRQGSTAVSAILHREVWFVYTGNPTIEEAGFLCWEPDIILSRGKSGEALYRSLSESVGSRTSAGNVLLDGSSLSGQIFAQFVDCLRTAEDTILPLRETSCSS